MEDPEGRLEALIRQYARLITSVVRRAGQGMPDQARQDAEQKVRISLWKKLSSGQDIEYPASYIYRMAAREALRTAREHATRQTVALDDTVSTAQGPPSENPHDSLVSREGVARIENAIAALAPDRARAVRGHLAGADVQDIMKLYGWSYQKARHLVSRGMADLRSHLRKRGIHG